MRHMELNFGLPSMLSSYWYIWIIAYENEGIIVISTYNLGMIGIHMRSTLLNP